MLLVSFKLILTKLSPLLIDEQKMSRDNKQQHGTRPLVVEKVKGTHLGPTPQHNQGRKKWFLLMLCQMQDINS